MPGFAMTPFLELALVLAIIILAAKASGRLAVALGQPSVLGELLAGILLGPSVVNLLHWPMFGSELNGEMINVFAEIGVLLLMFLAGLELHLHELSRSSRVSALAGSLGVLAPLALGWGTALLFGYDQQTAVLVGLILAATSVSISAQTLMELNALRSRVGFGLLGAAVFDDILVILLLSAFIAVLEGASGWIALGSVFLRMVVFLAAASAFGLWVLPRLAQQVSRLRISQGILALAIVLTLLYGVAAEVVGGMAAITGAFLAGLMFARTEEREALEPRVRALAYGFFVPIFFVNIGLQADLSALAGALWFTLVLIGVAIIGKIVGAGGGARLAGFSWRESLQLGTGMVSRGEVGLIIASVGAELGLTTDSIFSAVLTMVIVTTLVTPPMLRATFVERKRREPATEVEVEAAGDPPPPAVARQGADKQESGGAGPLEPLDGPAQTGGAETAEGVPQPPSKSVVTDAGGTTLPPPAESGTRAVAGPGSDSADQPDILNPDGEAQAPKQEE